MNQRPTIREQIDACRADSDDLHLPEHAAALAELKTGVQTSAEIRGQFDRAQRSDRVLRGAMQDVPLPVGLESRLLAAMRAAALPENRVPPLECAIDAAAQAAPADAEVAVQPASPIQPTRRRWLGVAAGSLTTAAALLLAVFLGNKFLARQDQPISEEQLASQVQEWLQVAESGGSTKWVAKTSASLFPASFLRGTPTSSRSISTTQGTITAYRVTLPGSSNTALLLALPTSANYPVNTLPAPATKVGASGGWTVGAWQRGGVLYILAVRSDSDARLEQFIKPQAIG